MKDVLIKLCHDAEASLNLQTYRHYRFKPHMSWEYDEEKDIHEFTVAIYLFDDIILMEKIRSTHTTTAVEDEAISKIMTRAFAYGIKKISELIKLDA